MSLHCEHLFETREVEQAIGTVRLETCPQLQTLDVVIVFALRVFFDSVSFFEVCEANGASDDSVIDHVMLVSDYSHSGEH